MWGDGPHSQFFFLSVGLPSSGLVHHHQRVSGKGQTSLQHSTNIKTNRAPLRYEREGEHVVALQTTNNNRPVKDTALPALNRRAPAALASLSSGADAAGPWTNILLPAVAGTAAGVGSDIFLNVHVKPGSPSETKDAIKILLKILSPLFTQILPWRRRSSFAPLCTNPLLREHEGVGVGGADPRERGRGDPTLCAPKHWKGPLKSKTHPKGQIFVYASKNSTKFYKGRLGINIKII